MSEESCVSVESTDGYTDIADIGDVNTTNVKRDININDNVKRLKRQFRMTGTANMSDSMSASKVNVLRVSVDKHNDAMARILLISKNTADKKATIESAFRSCKDAFLEVSLALINLLQTKKDGSELVENIKKFVENSLDKISVKASYTNRNPAEAGSALGSLLLLLVLLKIR